MSGSNKHTRGIAATIIFHGTLILLLVFFGLHAPFPPPQEEALLINFGTDNTGGGLLEPAPAPPASRPLPSKTTPKTTETSKEKILTQDIEEAAAVESGKETKPKKPTAEELRKKKQAEEARKKQEEARQKKRQEELERKRKEEEERKRREAQERKKQEILRRTKNAFAHAQGTANTASEGETGGKGNQGNPQGSVQAGAHSGTPGTGNGVSYSLGGRTPQKLPLPEYNYQVAGVVVVEVTVDRNGNVTKATPGVKGSTTLNQDLLNAAKKAALASKFDRKPDAPAFQKGTITYKFILQ
ncbi:MAG: hypothetical protein J7K46_11635 [Bacteroidales bacterium]|nr:hypothetical protein [Bacteroidales bacterium]